MTNAPVSAKIEATNPVMTVAPLKEETEMLGATNKITALYCRLSQEDERFGESVSVENHERILYGSFQDIPRMIHSPSSFVMAFPSPEKIGMRHLMAIIARKVRMLYIKPEEHAAYFVINGEFTRKVDF